MRADLHAVLPRVVFTISARTRPREPLRVVGVPLNRLLQTTRPSLLRSPTQLRLDLRRINRVTSIMTRSIFDVTDQRRGLAQGAPETLDDFEVALLVARADVVGCPRLASF